MRGISAVPILVHGVGLIDAFTDHCSQELVGKQSAAKASFFLVCSTTHKLTTGRHPYPYSPLFYRPICGVLHEQTSHDDDMCLLVLEEPAALYPKPLDTTRLLHPKVQTKRSIP